MSSEKTYKTPRLTFYYSGKDQRGHTFYNAEEFSWAAGVEATWNIIRDETLAHMGAQDKDFGAYFVSELVNAPGKWRSFGFYFWGLEARPEICKHYEKTISILRQIPGIVSASVSVLEPHSEIRPHFGDTDAIFRCHLPLVVPGTLPEIGFHVGYEQRPWQEGKLMIFNDAAYHKGWNHTDQKRVVLIFDVIRPELMDKKAWICAQALANGTLQNYFIRLPFLKTLPMFFTKTFHKIISVCQWMQYHAGKGKALYFKE